MKRKLHPALVWFVLGLCGVSSAQEPPTPPTEGATNEAGQTPDEAAPPVAEPGLDGEPTLPPIVVRPGTEPVDAPPTDAIGPPRRLPFDLPSSYPSLSQQFFGGGATGGTGLDSATRRSGTIFDNSTNDTIVDRAVIDQKSSNDMVRALQYEVDVLMQQTARGQASPFIRGLTGQQILVLIDGVRMNNSTYRAGPNQYFNLVDPGQVQQIEVIRGPQSVLWGADAIGGVINIVTRSASPNSGNYADPGFIQYLGSADTSTYSRANVEGWVGRSGVFTGGSYSNFNDLDIGGDFGRQPFTNYDQYAGDVKYNYLLNDDQLLTVAMSHFEQDDLPRSDRFPPFVFGPPASAPRPTWFDVQQRDLGYLRVQGLGSSSLFDAYSSTVSYSRNKEATTDVRSATRTDLAEFNVNTFGYTLNFSKELGASSLVYGADYYYDDINAFRNRLNPNTGVQTPDNPQFPNDSRYDRVGTFASLQVPLAERLDAIGGIRYESAGASGTINQVLGTPQEFDLNYHSWIGNVGLVYELNPSLNLVGNISQGYRPPNLDDLTADNPILQNAMDVPSLDVQPEEAVTYEVGFKYNGPQLRMQVFEFWTNIDNCILRQAVDAQGNPVPNVIGPYGTVIPGSTNFIRDNFDVYINGTELAGEYLTTQTWSIYGNFWYLYGQDRTRNEPFSRIPPTQGILGLRWRNPNGNEWFEVFGWLVRRQDRYAVQNNIDARFPLGGQPGYATLNMRIGRMIGSTNRHRISLTLENITNKYYRVLGSGVDGPGFNALLGYELLY